MSRYRLAVDTGGTFSDFVLFEPATGLVRVAKVPSTPRDPSSAVLEGLAQLGTEFGVSPGDVDFFIHGTTVGTNALLEGKGARTGLLITEGFRGVYETREQAREYGAELFDLLFDKPPMLAPQSRTFEVRERVAADGTVLVPLDEASLEAALDGLEAAGVESVAVCFLFSFLHPEHEAAAAAVARRRRPDRPVTSSAELLPQIREYYRLSTTAVNAYLAPRVSEYLGRLHDELGRRGLVAPRRYVMQSNGGAATFPVAAGRPVATLLSGPAGGVVSSIAVGVEAGFPNLISFDMGGTSCDVALIEGGEAKWTTRYAVAGHHVAVPSLDIHTVSAGGGTLAWVDAHGGLHVGPESAGADPGPVAYGRGGDTPTVTDCDLILGLLNPRAYLGGRMRLDRAAAGDAVRQRIAEPLGIGVGEAAAGVVQVVEVKMAEAIRAISTQRGYDLQDFTLVAFGGAGPVHAASLALDLGMGTVLVPPYPGAHSALGLLMCPVRHDYVRTRLCPLEALGAAEAEGHLAALEELARAELAGEGFAPAEIELQRFADLRYRGQGYEITVPLPSAPWDEAAASGVRSRFDAIHAQMYGHAAPDQPVELVSYRVAGVGRVEPVRLPAPGSCSAPLDAARLEVRPVRFPGAPGEVACPVYDRARLGPGHAFDGPAVVEQYDSTVVVPPAMACRVDGRLNLILRRREH